MKPSDARIGSFALLAGCLAVPFLFLVCPLLALFAQLLRHSDGQWRSFPEIAACFSTPGLAEALGNSLATGLAVTLIVVPLAFVTAYALTFSRFFGRRICRALCLLPLFVPSVLPAIAIITLFGSEGPLRFLLGGMELYGPVGVVLGSVFFTLPHAVLLLVATLSRIDGALYAAAAGLGAYPWRRFRTVTLPASCYGLVSAAFVVFSLTIADLGVPKVLGGTYPLLATEIFIRIIGLNDFSAGAALSITLFLPVLALFCIDTWARKKQSVFAAALPAPLPQTTGRAATFAWGGLCWIITAAAAFVLGSVVWMSCIGFWPYDTSLTLEHYDLSQTGFSWSPLGVSLMLSFGVGGLGTLFLYTGAYAALRLPTARLCRRIYQGLLLLPLLVPGMVLGVSYIFFFNGRPVIGMLYGTLVLLGFNCLMHFAAVGHLTLAGALTGISPDIERAGLSLGAPRRRTVLRVVAPLCSPAMADVFFYLFINTMTTISGVIFLYTPATMPASVALLHMYESTFVGEAAALGTVILAVNIGMACLHRPARNYLARKNE